MGSTGVFLTFSSSHGSKRSSSGALEDLFVPLDKGEGLAAMPSQEQGSSLLPCAPALGLYLTHVSPKVIVCSHHLRQKGTFLFLDVLLGECR